MIASNFAMLTCPTTLVSREITSEHIARLLLAHSLTCDYVGHLEALSTRTGSSLNLGFTLILETNCHIPLDS